MESLEIEFLAGNYFDYEIPPERGYLLKYFKTEIQLHFLKYYIKFQVKDSFVSHTGIHCSERHLSRLENRFLKLEDAVQEAKKTFDFKSLEIINLGKWRE